MTNFQRARFHQVVLGGKKTNLFAKECSSTKNRGRFRVERAAILDGDDTNSSANSCLLAAFTSRHFLVAVRRVVAVCCRGLQPNVSRRQC